MAGGQLVPTKEGNVDVETSYTDYPLKKTGVRMNPLDKNFSEDKLSDIEKYNVKLILEEEKSR